MVHGNYYSTLYAVITRLHREEMEQGEFTAGIMHTAYILVINLSNQKLNNMFSQRTVTSASLALKLSLIYIELIKSSSRTSGRFALFNSIYIYIYIYIQWYPQAFESSISCTGSKLQVHSCPQVLIKSLFCMGGRQRDLYSLRILIPYSLSHDIELSSVPLLCLCPQC